MIRELSDGTILRLDHDSDGDEYLEIITSGEGGLSQAFITGRSQLMETIDFLLSGLRALAVDGGQGG